MYNTYQLFVKYFSEHDNSEHIISYGDFKKEEDVIRKANKLAESPKVSWVWYFTPKNVQVKIKGECNLI